MYYIQFLWIVVPVLVVISSVYCLRPTARVRRRNLLLPYHTRVAYDSLNLSPPIGDTENKVSLDLEEWFVFDSDRSPLIGDTETEVPDLETRHAVDSDRSPQIGDTETEVPDLETRHAVDSDRSPQIGDTETEVPDLETQHAVDSDRSPPIGDTETEVEAPREECSDRSPTIGNTETEVLDLEAPLPLSVDSNLSPSIGNTETEVEARLTVDSDRSADSDRSPMIGNTETEVLDLEARLRLESTSPVLRASLTSQNFKDVSNKVWKARASWYNLGIQLGVDIDQLDIINKENPNNIESCFREMIKLWLKQEHPNWKDMISALIHETVNEKQLAARIYTALIDSESAQIDQRHTTLSRIESGDEYSWNSDKPTVDNAFPNLNFGTDYQKEELKAKLRRDTRQIRTEFAHLLVGMRKSFKAAGLDPQEIATSVGTIAECEPSTQSLGSSLKTDEVNSIDKFIRQLEVDNYISFINYHIVEFLINMYGSEEDKEKLQQYMLKFKDYCKRSVFEVPQDAYTQYGIESHEVQGDLDNRKLFVFKVTKGVLDSLSQNCTSTENESAMNNAVKISSRELHLSLGDVFAVQEKIADTLNVNPAALILVGASKGCVELTFSVPEAIIDRVMDETTRRGFAKLESQGIHLLCGPPGKPWAIPVRHACVSLRWNKPKYQGVQPVQEYSIHYQSVYDSPSRWKVLKTHDSIKSNNIDISIYAHQFGKNATCIFKVEAKNVTGSTFSEESLPVDIPWPNDDHDNHHHEITLAYLPTVMAKIRGAADKWREIGVHLGLTEQTLKEIEEDNSESTECLQNVLRKWIEQGEASMEKLRSALESSSVRAYKQGDELAFSLFKQGNQSFNWYAN